MNHLKHAQPLSSSHLAGRIIRILAFVFFFFSSLISTSSFVFASASSTSLAHVSQQGSTLQQPPGAGHRALPSQQATATHWSSPPQQAPGATHPRASQQQHSTPPPQHQQPAKKRKLHGNSISYPQTILADKPLIYYRLNEQQGPTAVDSSGNHQDGQYAQGTTYGRLPELVSDPSTSVGNAIVTQNGSTLPMGNTPRTFEVWFRSSAGNNSDWLMRSGDYSNHQFSIYLDSRNCPNIYGDNGATTGDLCPPRSLNDGISHLLDVTYNGSTVTVYLDGQIFGSAALVVNTTAPGNGYQIAGVNGGSEVDLQEAAFYGTALSSDRIAAHWTAGGSRSSSLCASAPTSKYAQSVLADTPLVYLRLGDLVSDQTDRVAFDSSSHCKNAAFSPGSYPQPVGALVGDPEGSVANALITQSGDTLPSGNAPRSFEVWFRSTSSHDTWLMQSGDFYNHQFSIYLYNRNCLNIYGDSGFSTGDICPPRPFNDGSWHLLDVTYNGSSVTLYLDGQIFGSSPLTVNTTVPGNGLSINSTDNCCETDLQEAVFYGAALTSNRINAHWTAGGSPQSYSPCASTPTSKYAQTVLADTPLVYLRLGDLVNDSTDRVAFDSSGHCKNAAFSPSSQPQSFGALVGDPEGAVTNGFITQSGDTLPSGNAPRTFEVWMRTTANYPFSDWLMRSGDLSDHQFSIYLYRYSCLYIYGDSGYSTGEICPPQPLDDGYWHMLDFVYDGSSVTLYLDGQVFTNAPLIVNTTVPGNGLQITGASGSVSMSSSKGSSKPGNDLHITGPNTASPTDLQEAAFYSTALSPDRIDAHWSAGGSRSSSICASAPTSRYARMVLAETPLVYLRLGDLVSDPTDRVAFDSSGHCKNAAFYPSSQPQSSGAIPGDPEGAVSNGFITQSGDSLPSGNAPRTFEVWFRTRANYPNNEWLMRSGDLSDHQFSIYLYDYNCLNIYGDSGYSTGYICPPQPLDNGYWHMLDFVYDGTNIRLYMDGQIFASARLPLNTTVPGNGLQITGPNGSVSMPSSKGSSKPGNGLQITGPNTFSTTDLQEAAYYPIALSPGQISNHASAGFPPQGPQGSEGFGGGNPSELGYGYSCTADPVDNFSGNFSHTCNDISIPGRGLPLLLSRTYNAGAAAQTGPFGYGWADSYNIFLSNNGGVITVNQENGSTVTFTLSGGVYSAPARVLATLVQNQDGSFTFTRVDQTQYTFNSSGQLTQEVDRNGYKTSFTYQNNQLSAVTDQANRSLTFTWTGNNITKVTDPIGRQVSFKYDQSGNLISATDLNGYSTTYTYDSNHLMLTMTDPNGGVLTNVYDSNKRVTSQTDPAGRATTFSYGNNTTTITDPTGYVTFDQFQNGLLASKTTGYGYGTKHKNSHLKKPSGPVSRTRRYGNLQAATWSYTYDPNSLGVTSITDPNGQVWVKTWDAQGNLLSSTDPLGRSRYYSYDSHNDVTSITDALGVTTNLTYDGRGNLTSASRPLVGMNQTQTTTYTYGDPKHPGDITAMTDPDSQTWNYTYDQYGDRISSTDPVGDMTSYTYDSVGRKLTQVSPKGNTTVYTYDNLDHLTSVTDPMGNETDYVYDGDGNRITVTDAKEHPTQYTYDKDNELTNVLRADGSGLSYVYDSDGNKISYTDGLNHTTKYTYTDPAYPNAVSTMTDALNRTTSYSYDSNGNRISLTDPAKNVTTYSYDAANQLTGISYSGGKTPNVTYSYDADGERTSMSDGTGTTSYTYDSLNRLTQSTNGAKSMVSYGYDLKGQLTSLTYPDGSKVTRKYDGAGRLIKVNDGVGKNGNTTTFSYDADSNLTGQSYPNKVQATFSFDNVDRVTSISDSLNGNQFLSCSYTRDTLEFLSSLQSSCSGQGNETYSYTTIDQLSAVNQTMYGYDHGDNLTQDGPATLAYDQANQLTSLTQGSSVTQFSYDSQGNRTQKKAPGGQTTNYTFDQANRLVKYGTKEQYTYNGDGLRMSKISIKPKKTEAFTWDVAEGLPLLLQDGTTRYVYGPGGLPLEQVSSKGTVLYYHQDQLGSTRALTDATGTVVVTYRYDAYGNVTASKKVANPFQYAGQYVDAESGFVYLRARYYDPATGQFINRDPAVDMTRQAYTYATDNPLNVLDPSGLDCGWTSPWDCIGQAVNWVNDNSEAIGAACDVGSFIPGVDVVAGPCAIGFGYLNGIKSIKEGNNACNPSTLKVIEGWVGILGSTFGLGSLASEGAISEFLNKAGDFTGWFSRELGFFSNPRNVWGWL